MRKVWTPERLAELKELYKTKTAKECGEILGLTEAVIKATINNHKLGGRGMFTIWTPENRQKLAELYPDNTNAELAILFGCKESLINAQGFKMKLFKSAVFKRLHAEKGMFKPGQEPPNKGQKMSPELYEKAKHTMFKKGNLPGNTKFDEAQSIRPDKRGVNYRFIRVSLGVWIANARFVWEQLHGPIPKGMCVWHKDLDTLNDAPENLELITRKENRIRNSGSISLTDAYVVHTMTVRKSPDFKAAVAADPELIETKRLQLQLNREITKITNECIAEEES